MPKSPDQAAVTYDFPVDGRTPEEVERMKEYGYGEDWDFAYQHLRTNGYFCGSCKFFEHAPGLINLAPSGHDGYCHKFSFRDRDYGCCQGWVKRA